MKQEDCEPATAPSGAPPARIIRHDTQIRRAALGVAAGAAVACVTLFALHLTGHLPLGRPGFDMWGSWLLALASTAARISYLRVPATQLADDFADRYAFGDAAALPLGDPALDPLLATTGPRCMLSRPDTWSLLGLTGGLCWGGAVALTAATSTGHVHPTPSDLLFALMLLLGGAVHCTCVAATAPRVYGQRTIRLAGALAHQRLRAQQGGAAGLHIVRPHDPDTGTRRAAR